MNIYVENVLLKFSGGNFNIHYITSFYVYYRRTTYANNLKNIYVYVYIYIRICKIILKYHVGNN